MPDLMNALNRAGRSAPFFRDVFALHIAVRVFEQRYAGRSALLRTPTDDSRFVNIQIARTGAATPFVFAAVNDFILKPIPTRTAFRAFRFDFLIDFLFAFGQTFVQTVAVVNYADG